MDWIRCNFCGRVLCVVNMEKRRIEIKCKCSSFRYIYLDDQKREAHEAMIEKRYGNNNATITG